jgi:tight adherence protein B
MILPVLTILIFLVTLGLVLSASYFFIIAPLQKQKLKVRLAAVQQMSMGGDLVSQDDILRRELLSDIPAVSRILAALPIITRLQLLLQQAAVDTQVAAFLLVVASLALFAVAVSLVLLLPWVSTLALTAGAAVAPFLVLLYKRGKRFSKFEEQFPDALELLARAIRAGHGVTTAFALIAEEMAQPVADEFRIVHQQQSLGLPIREALINMATRVPLPDVRIFVTVLQIQKDTGGNLGEILDNLSGVVRERFKIFREVRVLTAEGRLSMYFLVGMPIFVGFAMYFVNREQMDILFTNPLGQKMLLVTGIMEIIGYLIIRKMVRIKV